MGVVRAATAARWAVALSGVVIVGLLPAALAALPGGGTSRRPAQVIAAARGSAQVAHEGFVETSGSLGLPDLPRLGEVAALLGGTTQARVWWRSPTAYRVDRVTATGETDVYGTRHGLQTWDFESQRVRRVLSASPVRLPRVDDLLPPQEARRILSGVTPADRLSALPPTRIARRPADGVRIVPAASTSTVGRVDLYVDRATGLPLSVELYPRGSERAALRTRFLDVALTRPSDATLTPHVPRGARVETVVTPDIASAVDAFAPYALPDRLGSFTRSRNVVTLGGATTYGTGLARFVLLPLPPDLARSALDAARDGGGEELDVSEGEAVLVGTPLLNAVIARGDRPRYGSSRRRGRGYLVAGTVDGAALQSAIAALLTSPPPPR